MAVGLPYLLVCGVCYAHLNGCLLQEEDVVVNAYVHALRGVTYIS